MFVAWLYAPCQNFLWECCYSVTLQLVEMLLFHYFMAPPSKRVWSPLQGYPRTPAIAITCNIQMLPTHWGCSPITYQQFPSISQHPHKTVIMAVEQPLFQCCPRYIPNVTLGLMHGFRNLWLPMASLEPSLWSTKT